ncbi:hypothetical protein JNL27_10835 [bacterium]|nr:hypothetical protein [bacterium]
MTRVTMLTCFLIFFVISQLLAQDDKATTALQNKHWALQFHIGSNFSLSSFQGSLISLKRQFSEHSAFRFGVSFGSNISNLDGESRIFPVDTIQSKNKTNSNGLTVGIVTQYIRYSPIDENIVAYYGAGPNLSIMHSKYDTESLNNDQTTRTNSWGAGLNGVFGVEWFVKKNLSLSAEYAGSIDYNFSHQKNTSKYIGGPTYINESNSHGFNFGSNYVNFGLSVYFK